MGHFRSIWGHLRLNLFNSEPSFFRLFKVGPKPSRKYPQTVPKSPPDHPKSVLFFRFFRIFYVFCVIVVVVVVVVIVVIVKNVENFRFFRKFWDGFGMVWAWFWDGLGAFSDRFRTDFEKLKIWRSRIEKLTLKWFQIDLKINQKEIEKVIFPIFF